jgi:hypothetical protein
MIANEKQFDENLKRIGDLYEEGKDCLNNLPIGALHGDEMKSYSRLFEVIREMRDLAAINLKANHEIKDN